MTKGIISSHQHTGNWSLKLRRETGGKHFHKEGLAPNFPNLMKSPKFLNLRSSVNPNNIQKTTPRHIIVKLLKTKNKGKHPKISQNGEKPSAHTGTGVMKTASCAPGTMRADRPQRKQQNKASA